MNKLQYLAHSKRLLRKIVNYRRTLANKGIGKPISAHMAATMKNTEYQVGKIMSFDRMQSYLSRADVQENILELIPSNKKQWKYEFFELIAGEKRINNKPIPQQLELFI